ncbi:MAG: DNA photolyase family protein [Cytophagales bacterium]|nr:DNA photolyase family protein [Cytophagales bacterium]
MRQLENVSIPTPVILFWLRRDLRLEDNHGLYQALKHHENVLPIFIFDRNILDKLDNPKDQRVRFIYQQIQLIQKKLAQLGSSLLVSYGKPVAIFHALIKRLKIKAVYTNHDYEPYAIQRDQEIATLLQAHQISFHTFKDQVIFEKNEVMKDNGLPYTVFTPYMKKWKAVFKPSFVNRFETSSYFKNFLKIKPLPLMTLKEMGFQASHDDFPPKQIDVARIQQYDQQRDLPALHGTSRLSVHLRFGTISIREVTHVALTYNEVWLNELIWRNFYMMILWHFPHVVEHAFKPAYDNIAWINNEEHFQAWCVGRTGYPIVDAGMHELNETGYMHNRLRMITASFLTKHLLIDWRWGEAYFAKKLLDYELASNNGGWQWAAGSGCDAAPYFRIFNPHLQTQKFDPELKYITRWNPRFQELTYPKPIVKYKFARERALKTYEKALSIKANISS